MGQFESELRAYEDRENALAYREANATSYAAGVAQEVIGNTDGRRDQYIECLLDHDTDVANLLKDLLDDVQAGINPTDTLKRSIQDWSIGVAIEEEEWY